MDMLQPDSSHPRHHYVLAHMALRDFCFHHPLVLFGVIASPDKDKFMQDLWEMIKEDCDQHGESSFDISHVGVFPLNLKNYPAILFLMPQPEMPAEAFMTLAVMMYPLDQIEGLSLEDAPPPTQYFTLDLGIGENGPHTVFCSWEGEEHVQLGEGTDPDPQGFLNLVSERL